MFIMLSTVLATSATNLYIKHSVFCPHSGLCLPSYPPKNIGYFPKQYSVTDVCKFSYCMLLILFKKNCNSPEF